MIREKIEEIVSYLAKNVPLFAPFVIGGLSSSEKSIAFRLMPSSPGSRYFDRSRQYVMHFQIMCKSTDQLEALSTIESIADALEANGSEVYSEPQYLQQDGDSYIYSAAFQTETLKGGIN